MQQILLWICSALWDGEVQFTEKILRQFPDLSPGLISVILGVLTVQLHNVTTSLLYIVCHYHLVVMETNAGDVADRG